MADTRQRVEPGPPRPSLWDRLLGTGPGDDWGYVIYLVLIAMAGSALPGFPVVAGARGTTFRPAARGISGHDILPWAWWLR